jgi:hypothetical protein
MFEKTTTKNVTGPHLFFWGLCEVDDLIVDAWEHRCRVKGTRKHAGNVRIIIRTEDPAAFKRIDAEAKRRAIDNGRPEGAKIYTQFVGDIVGYAELIKALNGYAAHLGKRKQRASNALHVARQLASLTFDLHLFYLEDDPLPN